MISDSRYELEARTALHVIRNKTLLTAQNILNIHINTCIQFTKGKRAEVEYRKARSYSIV